jgi:hypothetical protein
MKKKLPCLFRGLLLATAVVALSNCTSPGGGSGTYGYAPAPMPALDETRPATSRGLRNGVPLPSTATDHLQTDAEGASKRRAPRQGLATQAGYEVFSPLTASSFYRKATGLPDAVDSFHYNNETGAKAMADALGGGSKKRGRFAMAGGRLEVALQRGNYAGPLPRYEARDKKIVVGEPGRPYVILMENKTKHPLEVVASVDSLDVMDGRTASVKKRGYIIPPKGELTIEGFRVDARRVKRFEFGSVEGSAAAQAGVARNVGVIGLAVYEEDGAQAQLARLVESQKRSAANPFGSP